MHTQTNKLTTTATLDQSRSAAMYPPSGYGRRPLHSASGESLQAKPELRPDIRIRASHFVLVFGD